MLILYQKTHFPTQTLDKNENLAYLCKRKSRSGAVAARWAHNPKVVSSSLASATKKRKTESIFDSVFFFVLMVK